MCRKKASEHNDAVALLAEGVDRNLGPLLQNAHSLESPSSRRAWIEIVGSVRQKETSSRRPPHGGRG